MSHIFGKPIAVCEHKGEYYSGHPNIHIINIAAYNWATTCENLSSGSRPTKQDSNQSSKLQRLATKLKFLLAAYLDMVLFNKRITKALIRLRGCAGWSAPLLSANPYNIGFNAKRAHTQGINTKYPQNRTLIPILPFIYFKYSRPTPTCTYCRHFVMLNSTEHEISTAQKTKKMIISFLPA